MFRIGIDVVDIKRLETALNRWPNLTARLFTGMEIDYCQAQPRPAQHLAVRFAAKEATFKALGAGWPRLSWKQVEVLSGDTGPSLRITGRAAQLAGGAQHAVSLSHDGGVAIAQVLLEPAKL